MKQLFIGLIAVLLTNLAWAGNVTVSVSVTPQTINAPGPVTVTWTSTGAGVCSASDGWSGAKALQGTETVQVSKTGPLTLTCSSATGPAILSWTPRLLWNDNTAMIPVGYQIMIGSDPTALARGPLLPATPTTDVVIQAPPGKQYFSVRSQGVLNGLTLESPDSNIVSKTVVADQGSGTVTVNLVVLPLPPTNLTVR